MFKLNSDFSSAIIGGIAGAITSAFFCFIFEKRKEHIYLKKNKQARLDSIAFIKSLNQYSGNETRYLKILQKLGNYRIFNMSPILQKVGIAHFEKGINGNYISLFSNGFYSYSKKELKVIIKDIKNCKYE